MKRKHYATDLTDREWAIIEPLVPAPKPGGRPCRWDRREILNGIYYVVRSGGGRRRRPQFPPPSPKRVHCFPAWAPLGPPENYHTRVRVNRRSRAWPPTSPTAPRL